MIEYNEEKPDESHFKIEVLASDKDKEEIKFFLSGICNPTTGTFSGTLGKEKDDEKD